MAAATPPERFHRCGHAVHDLALAAGAVEVKARATITRKDWRWIAKLRDARREQFRAGVIIYSGAQTLPFGDRLWAVPFAALWA